MNALNPKAPEHFDVTAEQCLLGRILTDEVALSDALVHCTPADFSYGPHARVVETAQALRDEGMRASPLTVRAKLGECPDLEELGGVEYLKNLCRLAPVAQSARDLARIIADLAMRAGSMPNSRPVVND